MRIHALFRYDVPMVFILITALIATAISLSVNYAATTWLRSPFPIFGDFFQLYLTQNPNIAFSIHLPGMLEPLLIGCALILFVYFAWKSEKTTVTNLGFGCILGGAVGNIIDRLGDGHVTDYFMVGSFPVFNVADSFITVGVGLLLIEEVIRWQKGRGAKFEGRGRSMQQKN